MNSPEGKSRLAYYLLAGFFVLVALILTPTAIVLSGGSPSVALVVLAILAFLLLATTFGVIGYRDARKEGRRRVRALLRAFKAAVTFWWSLGA